MPRFRTAGHAPPALAAVPALALSVAGLGLAGCGDDDTGAGPTGPGSTASGASFPVTITRMGGFAGFSDTVTVQADGSVQATTKAGAVSCTLEAQALATLREAAGEVEPTDTASSPRSPGADQMTVELRSGKGSLSVDDPRLARAAGTITAVLADITAPEAERTLCR